MTFLVSPSVSPIDTSGKTGFRLREMWPLWGSRSTGYPSLASQPNNLRCPPSFMARCISHLIHVWVGFSGGLALYSSRMAEYLCCPKQRLRTVSARSWGQSSQGLPSLIACPQNKNIPLLRFRNASLSQPFGFWGINKKGGVDALGHLTPPSKVLAFAMLN